MTTVKTFPSEKPHCRSSDHGLLTTDEVRNRGDLNKYTMIKQMTYAMPMSS